MTAALSSILAPPLALGTEYYLFGAAGLLSVCAFVGLILVPALGSYGRVWEKLIAGFLSLFVLAALVLIGLVIVVVIFLNWDDISNWSEGGAQWRSRPETAFLPCADACQGQTALRAARRSGQPRGALCRDRVRRRDAGSRPGRRPRPGRERRVDRPVEQRAGGRHRVA